MKKREERELKRTIGRLVLETRKTRRLSQVEFARRVGISQSHVSKFENGMADISLLKWITITRTLKLRTMLT